MTVIRSVAALKKKLAGLKKTGRTVGFVPTMGALHEGHLSLVRMSRAANDVTVVSIFVNPLQFGPREDFSKYPRPLNRDLKLLRAEKADLVFVPSAKELYAENRQSSVTVGSLAKGLCGRSRPTHFQGVVTIVAKLLNLVQPDTLYLGQKDYQQFRVVEQMVSDLNFGVRVEMAPIVREPDGLAMSSRNAFLDHRARSQAPRLRQALLDCAGLAARGERSAARLKKRFRQELSRAGKARLDYFEIVDAGSLRAVVKLPQRGRLLLAAAVYFGRTRLIDNILLEDLKCSEC